jgi:hypothetical protein
MYAEPARSFVAQHGGDVRTGVAATIHLDAAGAMTVRAGDETLTAPVVVSAVPWHALPQLFDEPPAALAQTFADARHTQASPIVSVNLWFDRVVLDEPFVGLPDRTMQWVFEKRHVFGGGASHLSLVSSGAVSSLTMTNAGLVALAHEELIASLPAVRAARLLRSSVVREPRATFSLAPGQPPRPSTRTPIRGFFLAGDWIDTGLPATIESAVRSGHLAADAAS